MSARRLVVAAVFAVGGYAVVLTQVGSTRPSMTVAGLGLVLFLIGLLIARRWIDEDTRVDVVCPVGCRCRGRLSNLDHADGLRETRKTP